MKEDYFASILNLIPIFILFVFFKDCFCLDYSYEGCAPKNCGDGMNVSYPFYIDGLQDPNCGYPGFKLSCNNINGSSLLEISGNNYSVMNIDYNTHFILLQRASSTMIKCPYVIRNLTLDPNLFPILYGRAEVVILSNCSKEVVSKNLTRYRINGSSNCDGELVMMNYDDHLDVGKEVCSNVVMAPVDVSYEERKWGKVVDGGNYTEVLKRGFTLQWNAPDCSPCQHTGGRCGYNTDSYRYMCFCPNIPDTPHKQSCPNNTGTTGTHENLQHTGRTGTDKKHVALITAIVIGVVMLLAIIILCFTKKLKRRRRAKNNVNVDNFLKNHEFLAPKRYSYSQVKKMTNSFKIKLGQGGFGSVYKGLLTNGSLVAIKVLSELKANGEDFINEVASVGRTCHVNIVTLVGYCCDGNQRALIYEFMPNGSLEKFIYGRESSNNIQHQLGWEKLHQIAIGIARGLEYLHSGCNTRILHFDIKPHNILLDQDFCPKISDFGLAKLFHEKRSLISVSHMRGTPGYIAPELFSRNFGQVSHKSDVYSYGMMILEMVGGRKNIEVDVDNMSEIYFPHWIYKKIEVNEEQLGLHGIVSDEENEMVRKMIIVGLWCIQSNPLNRPTISKVLEMLEADLTSLEIHPKPYFSSPARSIDPPSIDKPNLSCSFTESATL